MFKYTICFIRQRNRVLLLNREHSAWMGSWNGIGGKIEANETPLGCMVREISEETGMALVDVRYKGTVTWSVDGAMVGGMYAFIAEIPDDFIYGTPKKTDEGILDWKEISWILHPHNTGVASNLPKFLPKMLGDDRLYEHKCIFRGSVLQGVDSICLREDEAKSE